MSDAPAHVALLVDFANLRAGLAQSANGNSDEEGKSSLPTTREIARSIMNYAAGAGRVGVARAYADWSRFPQLARQLNGTRIAPVLVPATEDGEDRSHIQLTIDAMETLYNGDEPDAYVLVSSDPTLVPLVQTLRGDGSEIVLVSPETNICDEMREEADQFVLLEDVLEGTIAEPAKPRAFRSDRAPARQPQPKRDDDRQRGGQRRERGERRERTYQGPAIYEPDFHDYDWSAFIQLIDELEQRLPFVGVRYLVNKVLAPHNCGIDDPRLKRDLINQAVDDGLIEMYSVGNVNDRTDPVTACRLDRESELVASILGEVADADGYGEDDYDDDADGVRAGDTSSAAE